jgi:hypothetical protein
MALASSIKLLLLLSWKSDIDDSKVEVTIPMMSPR